MSLRRLFGLSGSLWEGISIRLTERDLFTWLILMAVTWLVMAPILLVVVSSFLLQPLESSVSLTLQHYFEVYLDPGTYALIVNTLLFGAGTILTGFLFALPLAWLVEGTNTPGRNLMYGLILVPMAIPPMISALGWERLLDPRIGLINLILRPLLGVEGEGPLNVFSIYGMAFVMGLSMVPTGFLMLAPVFRNMDPSFEEASIVAGATRLLTFRRVTLPLASPAFFAALIWFFIISIEAFEIPGVLGMQAGILVFSTRIFWAVRPPTGDIPEYGLASALAVAILVLSGLLVYVYLKALGAGEKFTSVTGRGYRRSIIDLGRWRYVGSLFFVFYMCLAIGLPLLVLAWGSLLSFYQPPSWDLLEQLSLENYRFALGSDAIKAFGNTGLLVLTAATLTTLVCVVASWIIVRLRGTIGSLLNIMTFVPVAIPSVIIGFALVLTYVAVPIGIYGTVWIIAIAHVTRYLSYGSRAMIAAQVQIHKELEEASYTCGATFQITLRRIVMPIVLPALVSLWLWVALHSLRELSAAVLLATPSNVVVSTLIWNSYYEGEVGVAYALSMILISASLIIAFAGRRFLTWGRA
ncbi:MAG: ABC transporter permease [Candidatus Binatia bacterium]